MNRQLQSSGYDADHAGRYESELGHGFTLPGERDCWLTDIGEILGGVAAGLPPEPRVLDIGCGTGKFTRLIRDVLCERYGREPAVHGVDASAHMLDVAHRLGHDAIVYSHADARHLDAPSTNHLVVSCQVLDSFERPAELMAGWRRNLVEPGGHVLTVLSFSRREDWANRTTDMLDRQPLAGITSVEPLVDATVRAGFEDVRAGFLPTVSPLYGGAATGSTGPIGSRYYAIARAPSQRAP